MKITNIISIIIISHSKREEKIIIILRVKVNENTEIICGNEE